MSKKVFCSDCRHYHSHDFGHYCGAVSIAGDDWYEQGRQYANPRTQNENNDCTAWQHKRGLIEWLNDLTKS